MINFFSKRTFNFVSHWLPISLFSLIVMTPLQVVAATKQETQQLLAQGLDLHKRGIWGEAALTLSKVSTMFEQNGDHNNQALALLTLAQSLDNLGRPHQALEKLKQAEPLTAKLTDPGLPIRIRNTIGNVWLRVGEIKEAKNHLQKALAFAKQLNQEKLLASIHNDLGTVYVREGKYTKAENYFQTSFNVANAQQLHPLMIASAMNLARLQRQQGHNEKAKKTTDSILSQIPHVPDNSFKAFSYLNAGTLYTELLEPVEPTSIPFLTGIYAASRTTGGKRGVYSRRSDDVRGPETSSSRIQEKPEDRREKIQQAYQTLQTSRNLARTLKDHRTGSFAAGFLGHLYEMEGRSEEGLILTREAIRLAQSPSTIDSLYQWHWQAARLKATLGRRNYPRKLKLLT